MNQTNQTYDPIKIFAPKRTSWIAQMLKSVLYNNSINSIIVDHIKCDENTIYIIMCHHLVKHFPKYYIIYQLEQVDKSSYFTKEYIDAINLSLFTMDYSMLNITNINKLTINKINLFPIPIANQIKSDSTTHFEYDIVFYGCLNERRNIILNKLKSIYKINIITDKFGDELLNEISKGKIILNLHYYKFAVLETARINESLQFENIIISEKPDPNDPNYELYKQTIFFIDQIDTDLDSDLDVDKFDELIEKIDMGLKILNDPLLSNDYLTNKLKFIQSLQLTNEKFYDDVCKKIKTAQFLNKLEIPPENFNEFSGIEEYMQLCHPNEWNYTKIMKKIIDDPYEMFKYFCCNQLEHTKLQNIGLTKKIKYGQTQEAVLIEPNDYPHIEFVIRNTIEKLNDNWSHTVVCSNKNHNFVKTICANISDQINVILWDQYDDFSPDNNFEKIITNSIFWNKIFGDNVLVYNSNCLINDEPIVNQYLEKLICQNNTTLIGNSNFSLRKKTKMIEILSSNSYIEYKKSLNMSIERLQHNIYYCKNNSKKNILITNLEIQKNKLNEISFFLIYIDQSNQICQSKQTADFIKLADFKKNDKFMKMCLINWNVDKKFIKKFNLFDNSICNYISNATNTTNISNTTNTTNTICTNDVVNVEKFGFIILRHINSSVTQNYWIECCNQIRKYYDDPIIVIDDNSNPELLNDQNCNNIKHIKIIYSEFGYCHGEILPYYYLHKLHLFDKAVILHDSMFVNQYVDFRNTPESFLWTFDGMYEDYKYEVFLLKQLDHSDRLIDIHKNIQKWKGCFGCCGIVEYNTVSVFQQKYKLFNIFEHINTRFHRCCFERIISILYFNETESNSNPIKSICGKISNHYKQFEFNYSQYIDFKHNNLIEPQLTNSKIIKIWSGR